MRCLNYSITNKKILTNYLFSIIYLGFFNSFIFRFDKGYSIVYTD